jgi:acyl-CoA reductase-like NAD-dependent aldehyde dehydrogenase
MTQSSVQLHAAVIRQKDAPTEQTETRWADVPVRERIARVCGLRHVLAENPQPWIDAVSLPFRNGPAETLAAEIIPLADACRFLEKNAPKLLKPKRLGHRGRPMWLFGVDAEIRREPLGTILIIGPVNYPLMIPGIQAVQALVAGNHVVIKPAPGTRAAMALLVDTLHKLGVPCNACICLGEGKEEVGLWLEHIDKVVLTGSAETGKAVLHDLAPHLLPSVMELSGFDSAIVLADADLDLAAHCLRFGLDFNGANSCIAPRRIFAGGAVADQLIAKLPGVENITRFREVGDVIEATNAHPFRLGASIFGSAQAARDIAARLDVGCVVINDMIVPTADPRIPFGGRGQSGFGVTRGTQGLLEMTAIKTISLRRHGPRLHLLPSNEHTAEILEAQLAASHRKTLAARAAGFLQLLRAGRRHRDSQRISEHAKDSSK